VLVCCISHLSVLAHACLAFLYSIPFLFTQSAPPSNVTDQPLPLSALSHQICFSALRNPRWISPRNPPRLSSFSQADSPASLNINLSTPSCPCITPFPTPRCFFFLCRVPPAYTPSHFKPCVSLPFQKGDLPPVFRVKKYHPPLSTATTSIFVVNSLFLIKRFFGFPPKFLRTQRFTA